ncbi:MAG: hypothetical protein ACREM8_03230 [Vulcanimicrobiaceae bacterium]
MPPTIPRLAFDELAPELAELLRPRVERLGYLGEFFRVTAHQPAALVDFYRLTEDLKKAMPAAHTEVVALTVAAQLDNAYERNQHERLCAKLGFSRDWIRGVLALDPDRAPELSADDRIVQRLTLALLARAGKDCAADRDAAIAALGPPETVALLMLVGRYSMHATIVNALELAPPVASIFADQPTA